MRLPFIDDRTETELAHDIEERALLRQSGWQPGHDDAGSALVHIGARYAKLVLDRINRVPERNYLAFLRMIGVEPLPPLPASVPLTFTLAEGAGPAAMVPLGTRVAAPPLESDTDEIVFETTANLVLTRAKLVSAFVGDAGHDVYSDVTDRVSGRVDRPFDAFVGESPLPHELFLACDPILTASGTKDVEIVIEPSGVADGASASLITWACQVDGRWTDLTSRQQATSTGRISVLLTGVPQLKPHVLDGVSAGWLRGRLDLSWRPHRPRPPRVPFVVRDIKLARVAAGEPASAESQPQLAFLGGAPLDISGDFYPFGPYPRLGDTLYLSLPDDLALPGNRIALKAELAVPGGAADDRTIRWECWDGAAWQPCGPDGSDSDLFTRGMVELALPATVAPTAIRGVRRAWVRGRLRGDYGGTTDYLPVDPTDPSKGYTPAPSAPLAAPVVSALSWMRGGSTTEGSDLTWATRPALPPSACLSRNDFTAYTSHWRDPEGRQAGEISPFIAREPGEGAALYLGFDDRFEPTLVTLYLGVEPPSPMDVTADRLSRAETGERAVVAWQYAGPGGEWRPLRAVDETEGLSRRGLLSFVGPDDLIRRECFGHNLFWIRALHTGGAFPFPPRLRRVLPNTVWATQATTITDEILGSGNATADQVLTAAQAPLLPGERVSVREPSIVDEPAAEAWVPWTAVRDFHSSGPLDWHYTVDRASGEIRFGDGTRGRVVPLGQGNVRISYRTGGGRQGNRPAGVITELKSGVPYVDRVTNHERAQGGAPPESIKRLSTRGPRLLRHQDRAITVQDIEDLAVEASSEVLRARAVAPSHYNPNSLWLDREEPGASHRPVDAGRTTVIVVPDSADPAPVPSLGLLREVETYLLARLPAAAGVLVAGPEWVRVNVTTTVVTRNPDLVEPLRARITLALNEFLHPLTGGRDGGGWDFGRLPRPSDLYGVIDELDDVDHVRLLTVTQSPRDAANRLAEGVRATLDRSLDHAWEPTEPGIRDWIDRSLVLSGTHRVTVEIGN